MSDYTFIHTDCRKDFVMRKVEGVEQRGVSNLEH